MSVEIAKVVLKDLVFHKSLPVRRSEFERCVADLVEAAKQEERQALAWAILAQERERSEACDTITTT